MAPTRIAIVHYSVQGHVRKMAQVTTRLGGGLRLF